MRARFLLSPNTILIDVLVFHLLVMHSFLLATSNSLYVCVYHSLPNAAIHVLFSVAHCCKRNRCDRRYMSVNEHVFVGWTLDVCVQWLDYTVTLSQLDFFFFLHPHHQQCLAAPHCTVCDHFSHFHRSVVMSHCGQNLHVPNSQLFPCPCLPSVCLFWWHFCPNVLSIFLSVCHHHTVFIYGILHEWQ